MSFTRKILLLIIFLVFISLCGGYTTFNHQNSDELHVISNETDQIGCCSIILQLDGNDTIMSYRRDSDFDANIHIEKIDWHGIPAIKQYKEERGYFCHVIVTNDGWVIGLGGIDDGVDNEIEENITATMINDDYNISKESLKKIQDIKKEYGTGHVVIKAPNGNYGFANVDKLKTGKLQPGQYISIPNNYQYSRANNVSLDMDDRVKFMNELAQSDLYGLDRREIITYDINITNKTNTTDIYISNEDGSLVGDNNTVYIDDIYVNNTVIKGNDIPIAPDYKHIDTITFNQSRDRFNNLIYLVIMILFVVFVAILSFIIYRLVKFIKFKIFQ